MQNISTPIAFFIFNRPEVTRIVFEEIAKTRPPLLLVIADGPRVNKAGEANLCALTRQIIESVDWECRVLKNYSDNNLGCKRRISSGLDWVFENVEEAIILEDDCLPNPSFFRFCEELLERYRNSTQIGMISGDNFIEDKLKISDSYYFSKYPHIWGWATWGRAWKNYDVNLDRWKKNRTPNWLRGILGSADEVNFWSKGFDSIISGKLDTWDYQWVFTCLDRKMLCVMPKINLISNIGFGSDATHTTGNSIFSNMESYDLDFPLAHPKKIEVNSDADHITANMMFTTSILKRIMRRIILPIFKNMKLKSKIFFSKSI